MNKKRPRFYVLDDQGNPVAEPDLLRWEEWFECSENRALKHDTVSGSVRVSTVFVGVDYNLFRNGPPLLWETYASNVPKEGYWTETARPATRLGVLGRSRVALVSVMVVVGGCRLPGPGVLAAVVILRGARRHVRHYKPRIVLLAHVRQLFEKRDRRPQLHVAVIGPGRHAGHFDGVLDDPEELAVAVEFHS
jgi:hypothetical protein